MNAPPINLRRMRKWASRGDVFIGETAWRYSDVLALVEAVEAAQAVKLDCPHFNHAPTITLCPEERLKRALARFVGADTPT